MENHTKQPLVFIVVLNFNGKTTLSKCLSSLYQSDYPEFEVVVVDNDSKDGSFEQAKQLFSRANFIKNPTNAGFSKGNNIGIRFALEKFADYVFILNNDAFVEKSTLSVLIRTMQRNPGVGISSPLIFSADNKIWFAGGHISWIRMKTFHLQKLPSISPFSTDYISGCAMLVKKEVFKEIGLFDERFFLYYEDTDLSIRAKKAGFDLSIIPEAKVQHLEQSESKNNMKLYWLVFSGLLFFNLNATLLQKFWIFFYFKLRKIKNFFDMFFGKKEVAQHIHKAYKDFKKLQTTL